MIATVILSLIAGTLTGEVAAQFMISSMKVDTDTGKVKYNFEEGANKFFYNESNVKKLRFMCLAIYATIMEASAADRMRLIEEINKLHEDNPILDKMSEEDKNECFDVYKVIPKNNISQALVDSLTPEQAEMFKKSEAFEKALIKNKNESRNCQNLFESKRNLKKQKKELEKKLMEFDTKMNNMLSVCEKTEQPIVEKKIQPIGDMY